MSESSSLALREIDQALRVVGNVRPRAGFEQRVLASIELAGVEVGSGARATGEGRWGRVLFFRRFSTGAKTAGLMVAAGGAGVAILMGGVLHKGPAAVPVSRQPLVVQPLSGGFGTASMGRAASEGLKVEHGRTRGRGTVRPRQGRAVLPSSPSHRADGSAVSESPYAQGGKFGAVDTSTPGAQDGVNPR
jgi:hypothetical protein